MGAGPVQVIRGNGEDSSNQDSAPGAAFLPTGGIKGNPQGVCSTTGRDRQG